MKTNKGALKRFKRTATGRIKYRKGFRNHILTKKSQKRKRHLRHLDTLERCDEKSVNRLLSGG
jgi:large subunit ribosomal protein L35